MSSSVKPRRTGRKLAAALPVIYHGSTLEVVLITSRTSHRYIPTKGAIKPGETPRDCAAREAHEEAGVLGQCSLKPVTYLKGTNADPRPVPMYLLTVDQLLDDWEERSQRERLILSPSRAALLIEDPELITVLLTLTVPQ